MGVWVKLKEGTLTKEEGNIIVGKIEHDKTNNKYWFRPQTGTFLDAIDLQDIIEILKTITDNSRI